MEDFRPNWKDADVKALWNFTSEYSDVFGSDTIGAVAVDDRGLFAVSNSTGGATPMLLGRIGDSPIVGCGFYAGPAGAVATTGIGEEIIRRQLARAVYDYMAQGDEVQAACERGVRLFPREVMTGVIAISRRGIGAADNRQMARAAIVRE
jgi:L-asparaginase/beta-aspartyl-peptidase (threonine type)